MVKGLFNNCVLMTRTVYSRKNVKYVRVSINIQLKNDKYVCMSIDMNICIFIEVRYVLYVLNMHFMHALHTYVFLSVCEDIRRL